MKTRLNAALDGAPQPVADYLNNLIQSGNFDATITAEQFEQLLQCSGLSDKALRLSLLPFAAAYSYAPISEFYVGSIVRGLSGKLYFGANMEFIGAQMSQTVHAEQSGISHAWMKGETGIKDITINYSPCGHCRQFMNELTTAQELKIQLPKRQEMSLQEYLPDSFGPADLDIPDRLMDGKFLSYKTTESDPLILNALKALNYSHAPYSGNFSGVALELNDGSVFLGSYAENAAFNPSLPPLQVALAQVLMAGKSFDQITAAALAELSTGKIHNIDGTQATLEALNPDIPLAYISI
ncbi:cytidine deaminase [Vibrio sp. MA40-2]|uniref:cytidine deaminase n=1 Tax=Vibrio sp. MA40-2 TaxID=3391828 RepID=UPI0039A58B8F